jgi:hypothetical protein
MNTRVNPKSIILFEALDKVFDQRINKARVKLISLFIIALNHVRTVNFERLAIAFDHSARKDSSVRRIQRFIADFDLQFDLIAKLVFSLLPVDPPYRLSMDRTNWKFGKTDINILMLSKGIKSTRLRQLFKPDKNNLTILFLRPTTLADCRILLSSPQ